MTPMLVPAKMKFGQNSLNKHPFLLFHWTFCHCLHQCYEYCKPTLTDCMLLVICMIIWLKMANVIKYEISMCYQVSLNIYNLNKYSNFMYQ